MLRTNTVRNTGYGIIIDIPAKTEFPTLEKALRLFRVGFVAQSLQPSFNLLCRGHGENLTTDERSAAWPQTKKLVLTTNLH